MTHELPNLFHELGSFAPDPADGGESMVEVCPLLFIGGQGLVEVIDEGADSGVEFCDGGPGVGVEGG